MYYDLKFIVGTKVVIPYKIDNWAKVFDFIKSK